MKRKKLLILGSNGLLGAYLSNRFKSKKFNLFLASKNISKNNKKIFKIDLNDMEKLKNFLKSINPDIIINCVANVNIDFCQKYKKTAFNDNAQTVKNLVYCFKILKLKPHLIHISTDQVYNGVFKHRLSKENEICAKNIYGISKLKGELNLKNYKKKTIIRTNFFGKSNFSKKKSFSDIILFNIRNKKKLYVPKNIYFNPIDLDSFFKILFKIINKRIFGTFNVGSKGYISKSNFAKEIIKKYNLNPKYIVDYLSIFKIHKRPLVTAMNIKKIETKLKFKMPTIQRSILNNS